MTVCQIFRVHLWFIQSVLCCLYQSDTASVVLCVRWTRGRWWLASPVGCWGRGRQSTTQTWWHPKRDSSSSGMQRWQRWQTGALGRAARWRKRGHWRWQSRAGPCGSWCTRAMAPADCGQRGKTSFCGCDLMIPFWFIVYFHKQTYKIKKKTWNQGGFLRRYHLTKTR